MVGIETALAAEKEKVKAATQRAKDLREQKKQLSNGKRINVRTAGRGFQMPPVAATSTDKENNPFLAAPSSHSVAVSSHSLSAPPRPSFDVPLDMELEPPISAHVGYRAYDMSTWSFAAAHPSYPQMPTFSPRMPVSTCPPAFGVRQPAVNRHGQPSMDTDQYGDFYPTQQF